jgi:small Trp-rich protein
MASFRYKQTELRQGSEAGIVNYSLGLPLAVFIVVLRVPAQSRQTGAFLMWFVAIGVVLLLLKLSSVAPVADWGWLAVLSPFAAAVVWWAWADSSGLTKRRAMQRMEERKAARRERAIEALGQGDSNKRR